MIVGLLLCSVVIFYSGKQLSYYGGAIARLSGLGNLWVGVVMLATVTSLPELVVGISSSAIVESADLAVGDVLGSCAFNLGILAMLDAFVPRNKPLFGTASPHHIITIASVTILVSLTGAGLFLPDEVLLIGWVGVLSFIFIAVYLVSMTVIYRHEKRMAIPISKEADDASENLTLGRAIPLFILFSAAITGAALLLPTFAEQLAEKSGLGTTFVGTLFLAAVTSLPEIAVSFAAIRVGLADMAIGNLMGSNLFNIFILAVDDTFYLKGFILKDASDNHVVSVLAVIIMNAVATIGLSYRPGRKRFILAWDSLIIFAVYALNLMLLYQLSRND